MSKFRKGHPGGPGRPRGSRNIAKQSIDEVGAAGTVKVLRTVIARASKGDMTAAGIVLSRTWPRRPGKPVKIDLPPIEKAEDLLKAQAALIAAAARGDITPAEGASFAAMLDNQRRAYEAERLERELEELERLRREELERLKGPRTR